MTSIQIELRDLQQYLNTGNVFTVKWRPDDKLHSIEMALQAKTVYEWCSNQFKQDDWIVLFDTVHFKHEQDAVLFILRWSEGRN